MSTVNKTQHIIYDENKNEILNYFETSADQVKMDDSNVKTILGSLSTLATTVKTSVINAINELHNRTLGIKGITTSTSVTETGYAADATTVAALNTNLEWKQYTGNFDSFIPTALNVNYEITIPELVGANEILIPWDYDTSHIIKGYTVRFNSYLNSNYNYYGFVIHNSSTGKLTASWISKGSMQNFNKPKAIWYR